MTADTLVPPTRDRVTALLERMANRRVVVIGDVMLDRYLIGDTDRLSPEAPVPVVSVRTSRCLACSPWGSMENEVHSSCSRKWRPITSLRFGNCSRKAHTASQAFPWAA